MDLKRVVDQLRAELKNLDAAIASLERLHEHAQRRGRPPAGLPGVMPKKGRPKGRSSSKSRGLSDK